MCDMKREMGSGNGSGSGIYVGLYNFLKSSYRNQHKTLN